MNGSPWQWRTVADPAALEPTPQALPPNAAQEWCNFILWEPNTMPPGCQFITGTLRKEAPPGRTGEAGSGRSPWTSNNPSAYRYEVAGAGRRLRVKQFLYDWAFPALDHPCLWDSETRAMPINDRYVLWFGTDYSARSGASARLGRTLIEVSVLDGTFTEDELVAFYRSLRPASTPAAYRIAGTPFAALSYPARHAATMVSVPVGMWAFRRRHPADRGAWSTGPAAENPLSRQLCVPHELAGFAVDSVAEFSDGAHRTELEVLYTSRPDRAHELRLIAQIDGRGRLETPPVLDVHPCTAGVWQVADVDVHLAYIDHRYGPFDAVWRDPAAGVEAKLLSTTGTRLGRDWFLSAVEQIVRTCQDRIATRR
jgi:hypothetical protein